MMTSPRNPGPSHTATTLGNVIVHELTHVVIWYVARGKRVPTWLNEGTAIYESNQLDTNRRNQARKIASSVTIPTLDQLDTESIRFSDLGGYALSGLVVEYIVTKYGKDQLVHLLKSPSDYQGAFGISYTQFEEDWKNYLITR